MRQTKKGKTKIPSNWEALDGQNRPAGDAAPRRQSNNGREEEREKEPEKQNSGNGPENREQKQKINKEIRNLEKKQEELEKEMGKHNPVEFLKLGFGAIMVDIIDIVSAPLIFITKTVTIAGTIGYYASKIPVVGSFIHPTVEKIYIGMAALIGIWVFKFLVKLYIFLKIHKINKEQKVGEPFFRTFIAGGVEFAVPPPFDCLVSWIPAMTIRVYMASRASRDKYNERKAEREKLDKKIKKLKKRTRGSRGGKEQRQLKKAA